MTFAELALDRVLDGRPEREGQPGALEALARRFAALARPRRVGPLGGVAQERHARGLAAHVGVEAIFEAREALVVGSHVSEHGGRESSLGIAPRRLGHELDTRKALFGDEAAHARRDRIAHAARQPDEVAILARELLGELLGGVLEERREQRGLLLGIGHVGGDREHRLGAGVHRQERALSIADDAASRGELDGALLLPAGAALELVAPDDLQVHEPHEENEDPETDPGEQEESPAVRARRGAQGGASPDGRVDGRTATSLRAGARGEARAESLTRMTWSSVGGTRPRGPRAIRSTR